MTTPNEPNVKMTIGSITQLTERGVEQTTDVLGEITKRFVNVQAKQMDSAVRAKLIELGWTPPGAITLNTGVQAQEVLRDALRVQNYRTDGDLQELAERCLHMAREDRDLIAMQEGNYQELRRRYDDLRAAPTGYAPGKVEALVAKWRTIAAGVSSPVDEYGAGFRQACSTAADELESALAALAKGEKA